MLWYGGTIAEAVALSKQRNAIFVVFIEGNNDMTVEMSTTLEDVTISEKLSDEQNFLAIKLKSDSQHYINFAQLYQFVPVPSLFFIGRNGTPLEVVCAGIQAGNLAARIDRILEEHRREPSAPVPVQPSTSSQNVGSLSAQIIKCDPGVPRSGATVVCSLSRRIHSESRVLTEVILPPTEAGARLVEIAPANSDAVTVKPNETNEEVVNTAVMSRDPVRPASVSHTDMVADEIKDTNKGEVRPREEEPESSTGHMSKIQKTHHEVTRSGVEYEVVCNDDVCVRVPKYQHEPGTSQNTAAEDQNLPAEVSPTESDSSTNVVIEQKLEKAKELIEARRREKAEKERELEKQRELERRVAGQGVAELKRWQAEQEMKQLQEERKREKFESNLARQRILEQIAQDRAERRAREVNHAQTAPPLTQTTPIAGDVGSTARIQFKLPSGDSHTAHFSADGTLADVRRYLIDNLQLTMSSFTLWTAFPRRQLVDDESSLRRLELAPSAALLVLPTRGSVVPSRGRMVGIIAFVSHLLTTMVIEPATQVWSWIRSRVFGPQRRPPSSEPETRPPQPPTLRYRPRSNIHRLTGDKSQDDDNNTWNGNSTQQM